MTVIRVGSPTDDELGRVAAASAADEPTFPRQMISRGYRREEWDSRLTPGVSWEDAKQALRRWRAHRGAGVRVRPLDPPYDGQTVALDLGVGPVHIVAACRVTITIDLENAFGFTYATLPGHPEEGEESFVLQRDAEGVITFHVAATSRPADLLSKLGGPVSRMIQQRITDRYLRLDGLAGKYR